MNLVRRVFFFFSHRGYEGMVPDVPSPPDPVDPPSGGPFDFTEDFTTDFLA